MLVVCDIQEYKWRNLIDYYKLERTVYCNDIDKGKLYKISYSTENENVTHIVSKCSKISQEDNKEG